MGPKLKATLLMVVVFALGLVAGISVDINKGDQWAHRGFSERRIKKVKHELALNPWQDKVFDEIVEDAKERAEDNRRLMRLGFRSIRRDSMQLVEQLLLPEQRPRFDALRERMRRHRHGPNTGTPDAPTNVSLPTANLLATADRAVDGDWKKLMEARRQYIDALKQQGESAAETQQARTLLDQSRQTWRQRLAERRDLWEKTRSPR
jgi:hypothetical protein